jgi:hypothetical protein
MTTTTKTTTKTTTARKRRMTITQQPTSWSDAFLAEGGGRNDHDDDNNENDEEDDDEGDHKNEWISFVCYVTHDKEGGLALSKERGTMRLGIVEAIKFWSILQASSCTTPYLTSLSFFFSGVTGFASSSCIRHEVNLLRRCQWHPPQPSRIGTLSRDVTSDTAVDGATRGDAAATRGDQSEFTWDVYVSQPQSKSKNRGVTPTTSDLIQTFISLAPASETVGAHPVIFHKQNKQKGKGLTVRCVRRKRNGNDTIRLG